MHLRKPQPQSHHRRPSAVEMAADALLSAERKVHKKLLLAFNELPSWLQDNHFITSGYRQPSGSYLRSWASLGYLHNETVNIWTHLLGAIVFSILSFVLYNILYPRYRTATSMDVVAFGAFFLGAAFCLGLSATYHATMNHSPGVARFGNQLDYLGIVLMITGSFIPSVYYGFFCDPPHRYTYWVMITTIGAGCTMCTILPQFRTPKWRPFRALMFIAMGLSAIFPVIHGAKLYGLKQLQKQIGLFWVVLQGVLYIMGASIYAARIPERWSPGTFNIFGSSHQIFHVLVVAAAASQLTGIIKAFDYNHSSPVCLSV